MSTLRKMRLIVSSLIEPRCPKHPFYQGLRLPKVDCEGCDLIYKHSEEVRNDYTRS